MSVDVVASQVSTVEIRLFIGTGDKNTAAADKKSYFFQSLCTMETQTDMCYLF